ERVDDDEHDDDEHVDDDEPDDNEPRGAASTAPVEPWVRLVKPTLLFLGAVAFIDAFLNVRYPLDAPAFWYFLPPPDVPIIALSFAIMGLLHTPVPKWLRVIVVVWLVMVRVLRFGDGTKSRYFAQRFNLYSDLPLVADGARFLHSTLPLWQLVLG